MNGALGCDAVRHPLPIGRDGWRVGAGVDIWLGPWFGIRVGGDYRRILVSEEDDGEDSNEFRLHAGVVLGMASARCVSRRNNDGRKGTTHGTAGSCSVDGG